MHQFTATSTCSAYFRWIMNFEARCWAAIFHQTPRPANLKSRTKIFRKAIAMCGSGRRLLRSRLFLQLYNTRRHWRVSVSGLESSAVRGGWEGEEEKKRRSGRKRRKRWRHIHSCPRGTRRRPLLEYIVNCSGIQDTLRSWTGDARARAKRANSSFEPPLLFQLLFKYKYTEYRINGIIMAKKKPLKMQTVEWN